MLSFFVMWLVWLALCLFCAGCEGYGMARPLAQPAPQPADRHSHLPLTVLCAVLLALCLAGCAGWLRAGAFAVLAAGAAAALALAALLVRDARQKRVGRRRALAGCLISPAWLLAFGGSAALALFLAWQRPLFTQWDEFSFWGMAAKVVHLYDELYTVAPTVNLAARSYPPALPVLGYAFSFLNTDFAPWVVYAGYNALVLAALAAVVGALGRRWTAAFGAVCCFVLPWLCESWTAYQQLGAYTSAYADLPLGALCAGGLAIWYTGRGSAGRLWRTLLAVVVLGLIKDVGLPLGLVLAALCAADLLACEQCVRQTASKTAADGKKRAYISGRSWLRAICVAAVLAAGAVAAYFGWAAHLSAALGQDRLATDGSAGLSAVQMVVQGVRELVGIGRSEKFTVVLHGMVGAYIARRVSAFGSGLAVTAVVALLLAAAVWPRQKTAAGRRVLSAAGRRAVWYGVLSTVCFGGYNFFQLLCYVYVFSEAEGRGLVAYPRYMSSWYLFWLLGALLCCFGAAAAEQTMPLQAAADRAPSDELSAPAPAGAGLPADRSRHSFAVMAAAWLFLALCFVRLDISATLFGRSPAAWQDQTMVEQRAAQALAAAGPQDKALVISQWTDGGRWYQNAYALEPIPVYHTGGDNTFFPWDNDPKPYETLHFTADTFGDFLLQNGCTLLVLDLVDYDFWYVYGPLFTDGLAGWQDGSCLVYRVQQTADGVRLVPIKEAAS